MQGPTMKTASTTNLTPEDGPDGLKAAIARRLSGEFGAPVGLLDPRSGSWVSHAGAPAEAFPRLAPGLAGAAASHGRAAVWHDDAPSGAIWLLLTVPDPGGPLLAVLGFAATPAPANPS